MISGELLRRVRELRGYKSQAALADAVGIDRATINQIETDKEFPPKHVRPLALVLEVSTDFIYGDESVGTEDAQTQLVYESYRLFVRKYRDTLSTDMEETLLGIRRMPGAPITVDGWANEYHKVRWILRRERNKKVADLGNMPE